MSVNMKQNGALVPIASLTKAITPLGAGDCYSTEERQVGTWIDGKPLYQKTIDVGSFPNNASKQVAHNITNLGFVSLILLTATDGNGAYVSIPFTSNSLSFQISCYISGEYIRIDAFSNRSAFSGYATIQYTKTTDTAGSGIWTPSGAQAAHYSTTEQVVGDYMGDPLYGRITDNIGVSVANTSWTQVASIPNGKDIINLTVWTYFNEYALINYNQVQLDSTTGNLYVRFTSDVVGRTVYRIYAEYTKTV